MNLGLVKLVLWLGTLALFGGLAHSLYEFKTTQGERRTRWISVADQEQALKQPKPESKELPELPYEPVKDAFYALNWTGKEEKPVEQAPTQPPPREVKIAEPVDRLIEVLFVQEDTSDPGRSLAMVKYVGKLAAFQAREKVDGHVLVVGDRLPKPFAYWELVAISAAEGLTFTCTDQSLFDRAVEDATVAPPEPIKGDIPLLGDDGSVVVEVTEPFPQASAELRREFSGRWPQRTYEVRRGYTIVGTEDAARIEDDYLDILSQEVRHRSWRNPKTGRYEGIEILEIAPGSVAADFGVRSGDVIKSVNGHAVASVNEAITFAKNNAEYYSVWEVVVENAGKERTITIETPPSEE